VIALKRLIVLSIGPYSCLLWRMCFAYADCESFFYVACVFLVSYFEGQASLTYMRLFAGVAC
jgi:hypothetical protein